MISKILYPGWGMQRLPPSKARGKLHSYRYFLLYFFSVSLHANKTSISCLFELSRKLELGGEIPRSQQPQDFGDFISGTREGEVDDKKKLGLDAFWGPLLFFTRRTPRIPPQKRSGVKGKAPPLRHQRQYSSMASEIKLELKGNSFFHPS